MKLRVLLDGDWPSDRMLRISRMLSCDTELTTDPGDGKYRILVSGRPDAVLLESSNELEYLLIPFAGLPSSTAALMREFPGISVHNIHHNARSAAELALGLIISAGRRIVHADRRLRVGDWTPRQEQSESIMIYGSNALILGYGSIGSCLGSMLQSMGCNVRGTRRSVTERTAADGADIYPTDAMPILICDTDILVLTLPLTNETRGIIGDSEMANMHERSILVNVGRGALVDEDSLYEHLRRGSIGAAGIDVWYRYPSSPSDYSCTRPSRRDFENLANLVMTPHLGGAFGAEKLESLRLECLAKSIKEVAEGREMPFRVNLELGY